jgi:hypothetical protein
MTSHSTPSVSCFFNEPAELAYIASCGYYTDPFLFPEVEVIPNRKTETVFNTSTLTFEPQQPDDNTECALMCGTETPDGRIKYLPSSCSHTDFVCRSCVLRSLEANNRFNVCPFCRNPNFCPRLTRQTITTITGYTSKPITEMMIMKYREELDILEYLKMNGDYYRDNILNKDFKDLTEYQRFYWNIHKAFVSDIEGDAETDLDGAYNFYIERATHNSVNVPEIEEFDTPETTDNLTTESKVLIVRNEDSKCYNSYTLTFMSREDLASLIADYVGDYPLSISNSFVFQYLITKDFKKALGNENNEIWCEIIRDSDNEDFLRNMLRPNAEMVDAINNYYIECNWDGDDLEDILGYKLISSVDITHWNDVKKYETEEELYLCVRQDSVLY